MGALIGIVAPFVAPIVDWLHRRKLLKDTYARNFYAWVDYQGERHQWPVKLRDSWREQGKRLDETGKPPSGP